MVNLFMYSLGMEEWCSSERLIEVHSCWFLLKFLTGKRIMNCGIGLVV